MAIVWGEYGPYDDGTGMPVYNAGGESGTNWMTVGNESVASVPVGSTTASVPESSYIVRGNYRMPKGFAGSGASGALEVRDANGNWVPVTAETAPAGYDYQQDSNTQGSNERLRFDQAFGTAPADVPITNLQQWAMANGWTEPNRSNNEGTLGSMFSNIAPYAGLMLGGIGAMGGLSGLLGSAGSGALAAGDSMAGLIPAGELGAWTGAAGAAGAANTAGGNGMWDWLSNMFNGGPSGASELMPSLANASDPIEAMYQAMQATGTTSAEEAASALGFGSFESLASAINPAWAGTNFNTLLNNARNLVGNSAGGGKGGSLLGTALGGLLGSINGSKQAGTTTTTQEPWAGQQPYLLDAFQRAQAAANGSPLQSQANANYSSVLSGPTKNPMLGLDNPYLTKAIDNANSDVTRAMMPAVNQANRASGSFGNSGVADVYGKNLTDAYSRNATGMRMTDFTNQQNLQQKAVDNTLGFTTNANNYVAQPSQNYAQTVQGSYGGSTTTPYFNNPMSSILGGAMVGNKIGSNLGF